MRNLGTIAGTEKQPPRAQLPGDTHRAGTARHPQLTAADRLPDYNRRPIPRQGGNRNPGDH